MGGCGGVAAIRGVEQSKTGEAEEASIPSLLFAFFPLWLCLAHSFIQKTLSGDRPDNQDTLRQ